jgi:hypothetical protein
MPAQLELLVLGEWARTSKFTPTATHCTHQRGTFLLLENVPKKITGTEDGAGSCLRRIAEVLYKSITSEKLLLSANKQLALWYHLLIWF